MHLLIYLSCVFYVEHGTCTHFLAGKEAEAEEICIGIINDSLFIQLSNVFYCFASEGIRRPFFSLPWLHFHIFQH